MERREVLKLLAAGGVLPVFSPDLFAIALQVRAQMASAQALRTLNPHQDATVARMADLIIPETDTPGAKAVRVNEFIDLILTEWATEEERKRFLDGLGDVDRKSNELFAKNFVDCTPAQQEDLLRSLDEAAVVERQARSLHPRPRTEHESPLAHSFFESFKRLTLTGYYTSEVGFKQELREEIIPGALHGCAPLADFKQS
jgi:hypothetical protein